MPDGLPPADPLVPTRERWSRGSRCPTLTTSSPSGISTSSPRHAEGYCGGGAVAAAERLLSLVELQTWLTCMPHFAPGTSPGSRQQALLVADVERPDQSTITSLPQFNGPVR